MSEQSNLDSAHLCARWLGGAVRALLAAVLLLPALALAQTASNTALTTTPNPSTYGQSVTLTATVTGTSPSGTVTFMDGVDTLGVASLGAGGTVSFAIGTLSVATHSLAAVYAGDANNTGSTSGAVNQVVNKANTTSSVAASPNPSTYGATVTFTATVTGQGPTGTVTFKDGATTLGTGTLGGTGNSRTITFAISSLSVATHSITVVYAGDANNNTSTSSAVSQVVNKAATSTALATSPNPSVYTQGITMTATVTGGVSPGGSVTFKDGSTTIGTGVLSGGVATYTTSTFALGTHSLTAVYAGDANNNTSTSSAVSQVVNKNPTTTTLASSVNPSVAGQVTTLTATVSGASPSGQVTFKDGAITLATRSLTAGSASAIVGNLAAGSHGLTAVYAGDTYNTGSTSATLTQTVSVTTSSLVLSAPSTASEGQNVTLIAQVTGFIPSGLVTFTDGASTLGTASVNAGAATFSTNQLALGSHSLAASYAGDSSNTSSTATAVGLTVSARTGTTWQYGYDAMGRINTRVDPNGLATYIYYDSLGRAIQTQQPPNTGSSAPTVIQMGYDLADGLTRVVDPRVLTTTYNVSGLGTVKDQASPDSGNSQYSYDAKGNVLASTDARGKTTTFTWDSLDRLTAISYPTGTGTAFEYDGGASPTPAEQGELTKMTDESGQSTYTHDALGRLTTKTIVIGSRTFTIGYGWGDSGSALDKLTAITYPSGSRVNYGYDVAGFVNAISVTAVNPNGVGLSATTTTLLGSVTYSAENRVTGWLWSDGKARAIGYDSAGMVTSYTLGDPTGTGTAAGSLRTVTRDAAGRITGYSHTNNGNAQASLAQGFAYDNLDRLLTATLAGTGTAYSYDETGNRTSKTIGGTTYTNAIASNSNKLTQTQDVGGTATVVHDAAGHITSDGTNTFTYNDRGRMTSAANAGGTVTYTYNGLNQRVRKSGPTSLVPTGAGYFLYDEAGQLLGEYDASGAPVYETIYLGTTPVGVMKQTGTAANSDIAVSLYNVSADHIDTPRVITKQDHTIVWRWDTAEAFGATAPDQNPSSLGVFAFNQRFPGQVFDSETGLFQNWNREYNARLGRYIQFDPIGLRGGINGFVYVENSPLMYVDPLGLQAVPVPVPPPRGVPSPGRGRGSGGYDPRIDRFTPAPTVTLPTIPNWRDLFKSKSSELEQCEAEAEEKLDRDYAYCKALGATYNDYRTRKACEEKAFDKYVKKLKECKQQCP